MTNGANLSWEGRSQEARRRIQTWLTEEGWRIGEEDIPEAVWVITGQGARRRHITIAEKANRPDQVLISGGVSVSEEHRSLFAALPSEERDNFMWDLRFALLAADVEFDSVGDPPESFAIVQRIYHDGLTKDVFFQRVSQVRKGVLVVMWKFAQKFQPASLRQDLGLGE